MRWLSSAMVLTMLAGLIIPGCQSSPASLMPDTEQLISGNNPLLSPEYSNEQPVHNLWGFWWIYSDSKTDKTEIVPARALSLHGNIRKFLEDGYPCTNCLQLLAISPGPNNTKYVDIRITHPFPGNYTLTGFDLRGILMWNGSETWPASGLRTQKPNSPDGYVVNADGYTTIFNPTWFPQGSDIPLFTYTKGVFASHTIPNSTLNPYLDYWTSDNRRMFLPSQAVTRTWQLKFPVSPSPLGYAVDVCWTLPNPIPPIHLPGDFPITANRPEPYKLQVSMQTPIGATPASTGEVQVKVWDWQSNPASAWIECPYLWIGKKTSNKIEPGAGFKTLTIPIINQTGAPAGTYRALVGVTDSSSAKPPWDYTSYTFFNIEVVTDPCCLSAPVAQIDALEDVITGQDVTFTSLSYDPDGPNCKLTLLWDTDTDGLFDDGSGDSIIVSWDKPGLYQVRLKAIDSCNIFNIATHFVFVHVGITQSEDQKAKIENMRYNMISADLTLSEAEHAVDLNNTSGPWDFTALPLTNMGNYTVVLNKNHPETDEFKDLFDQPFNHFYKAHLVHNITPGNTIEASAYLAESYAKNPDRLQWIGLYQDYQLPLPVILDPMLEISYPLWIYSNEYYVTGLGTAFSFTFELYGWAEGTVKIPYQGGQEHKSVVLVYTAKAKVPDHKVSVISYIWYLDNGVTGASVVAGNDGTTENWDITTGKITGVASFNALYSLTPY